MEEVKDQRCKMSIRKLDCVRKESRRTLLKIGNRFAFTYFNDKIIACLCMIHVFDPKATGEGFINLQGFSCSLL